MTSKTPPRPAPAPAVKRPDLSRQITSAHIADHLEAFRAAGGKVEVLGVTPVLKRVAAAAAPGPSAT